VTVQETGRGYRIAFPPGVDRRRVLGPIDTAAVDASPEYRRLATRNSPLLFGLVYLAPYLVLDGTDRITLSEFHLDLARAARRWRRPEVFRDGWIAPRGAGKSVFMWLVLPLWALAHGHRRFLLGMSYTRPQAVGHLANLRMELSTNTLLQQDYPGMTGRQVRGAQNTTATVMLESGATIAARGLGETALGIRSGADRPDLILIDDAEPLEDYTPAAKEKLERKLVEGVLPMGSPHAAVQMAGTTTMFGSMAHDLVRAARGERTAPWIADTGIRPRYYPAIIVDPDTGLERSLWPQRWPLEELQAMRHTRSFSMNFQNNPSDLASDSWWSESLFRCDERFPAVEHALYVDVATTSRATSDYTAMVVVGRDASGRRAVVEEAWHGRLSPSGIRERVHRKAERNPTLRTVRVETNQGGSMWEQLLSPLPAGVRLETEHVARSKVDRLREALDHYERRAVVHRRPLRDLEDQARAYPGVSNDDLIDALAGALRWAFPGRKG
jgi:hypothetical protein